MGFNCKIIHLFIVLFWVYGAYSSQDHGGVEGKDPAHQTYTQVRDELKKSYRYLSGLRILHPQGEGSLSGTFFKGDQVKISCPEMLETNLGYFDYDLVILDKVLEKWVQEKKCDDLKAAVQSISDNSPFLLLQFPQKNLESLSVSMQKVIAEPRSLFPGDALLEVKNLEGTPGSYLVIKRGVELEGKKYEGRYIAYNGAAYGGAWIGKEKVVKVYHTNRIGSEEGKKSFETSVKFVQACSINGLDFIPPVHQKIVSSDRLGFVMPNCGHNLMLISKQISAEKLSAITNQIVDILLRLEAAKLTNFDMKANNLLVNEQGKVLLIDFDQALLNQGPVLGNFLNICWGMVDNSGQDNLFAGKPGYLESKKPEEFGPVLSEFVRPILEGKVKNFAELKAYLASTGTAA